MTPSLAHTTLFALHKKTALVTGGATGLGFMMATSLVQNGCRVLIASRKQAQLEKAAAELNGWSNERGGSAEWIVADLGSKDGCDKLVEAVKAKCKDGLHILVNNSGVSWGAKFDSFPEAKGWDAVLATNVKSIFYLSSGLAPLLEKNGTPLDPGRIVNITSVAGLDPKAEGTGLAPPGAGLWSYNTSKAAANHLTSQLAVTLGPRNITCNAILPGVFPSNMTAFGMAQDKDNRLAASHPMGRMGTPEDIAGVLTFLVSRAGAHVSGNLISVDGGALLSGRGYARL